MPNSNYSVARLLQIALFFFNIYLFFHIIYGEKGLHSYLKHKKTYQENSTTLQELKQSLTSISLKVKLLNFEQINLSYLQELAKLEFNLGRKDEFLIIIDDITKAKIQKLSPSSFSTPFIPKAISAPQPSRKQYFPISKKPSQFIETS